MEFVEGKSVKLKADQWNAWRLYVFFLFLNSYEKNRDSEGHSVEEMNWEHI